MKANTNSNTYTIVYSAVIVVIVAFLLAFVYQALKPQQDANVALDQKKQILNSLNQRDLDGQAAEARYAQVVKEEKKNDKGLTYYVCNVDGETKYVFPMKGMGLWGGISGFLAVNADKTTVFGAYFNHEGETAGLGAEIKDNTKWQQTFTGKKIFDDADTQHKNVILEVVKNGTVKNASYQVDGITGATLTNNGVKDMLKESLTDFEDVLAK